jgi:hypothetical protein
MMGMELINYDIVPIFNYGWSRSFANVLNNMKVILEMGWNPFNQMLLLHPELRKTMTDKDKEGKLVNGIFPASKVNSVNDERLQAQYNLPRMRETRTTAATSSYTSTHYLKKIIKESDFEEA